MSGLPIPSLHVLPSPSPAAGFNSNLELGIRWLCAHLTAVLVRNHSQEVRTPLRQEVIYKPLFITGFGKLICLAAILPLLTISAPWDRRQETPTSMKLKHTSQVSVIHIQSQRPQISNAFPEQSKSRQIARQFQAGESCQTTAEERLGEVWGRMTAGFITEFILRPSTAIRRCGRLPCPRTYTQTH